MGEPYVLDTVQDFLSAAFHELAHVLNYRNGKYMNYHGNRPMTDIETNILAIKTAIRAEKYTDKVARELMRNYFPGVPYIQAYDKKGVEAFRKLWLDKWKLKLGTFIVESINGLHENP